MRPEPNCGLELYRRRHPTMGRTPPGVNWGYFVIKRRGQQDLRIISSGTPDEVSVHAGWEHVSVSLATRFPAWDEMQMVKGLFWGDDETVIQFHPKKSAYVNCHPFCLHLWKRVGVDHQLPPVALVGPQQMEA